MKGSTDMLRTRSKDSSGRLIDGDANGTAGGNAVAVIRRTGVTLNPVAPAPPVVLSPTPSTPPVVLDPTTSTAPVVSQPIYYALVDAVLARRERMM